MFRSKPNKLKILLRETDWGVYLYASHFLSTISI